MKRYSTQPLCHGISLIVLAIAMLYLSWIGFQASDDIYYYRSGLGWLTERWYIPPSFGDVRTTVALPIAISLAVFGDSEFAAVLPTCFYMIGCVLLSYWRLTKLVPASLAFVACGLLATFPALIIESTTPSADLAEVFWVTVAFWSFLAATRQTNGSPALLLLVGVAVGLAFTAHETVLAFVVFLGVLFLAGYRIPRWRYWIMSLGFFVIIGGESAYYAIASGDPFYRFNLLIHGFSVAIDRMAVPSFTYDDAGTLRIWNPIDPLVMVLTRHNFGIAYYVLLPILVMVAIDVFRRRGDAEPSEEWRAHAGLAALAGTIWFVFAAIVLIRISLMARYYLVPTYLLFVSATIFVSHKVWPQRRRLMQVTTAAVFVVNLAAISVGNKNPRPGERAVAEFVATHSGPLRTDPYTAARAHWFVQWAHQDPARILAGPPQVGDLYLFNSENATRPNRLLKAADVPLYTPDPKWPVVWKTQQPPPVLGQVLGALGIGRFLPPTIRLKLTEPKPPILVYEVTTPPPIQR